MHQGICFAAITIFSLNIFAQCTTNLLDISMGMDATNGSSAVVPCGCKGPK